MSDHELVRALEAVGLEPRRSLRDMLDEHPSHRTLRRGCGYTQATRFLADHINRPRDPVEPTDLGIFANWPLTRVRQLAVAVIAAGWPLGWRRLERCPESLLASVHDSGPVHALRELDSRLASLEAELSFEESRLFLHLLRQVLSADPRPAAAALPYMPEKPEIGSCSQAEEFFLEIAHGRIRRGGRVNVFVDARSRPLLVEKINLGESHSAIAVADVTVCGVTLPPGSLFALRYRASEAEQNRSAAGTVLPVSMIEQARFLRLTTLAVPPQDRRRAFSAQMDAQLQSDYLSPGSTTIQDLCRFAHTMLTST